jgi:molybdopterin synthase catalytic subunit
LRRSIRIQEADFDVAAEWRAMREALGGNAGAIAAFCGLVRDVHGESEVKGLFLEHFPGFTERSLDSILDRVERRWTLDAVSVLHRVGRMHPGEQIVLVLVAGRHRSEAFAACELVMDYLKTDAIFWKKEIGVVDERWVEATGDDQRRRRAWDDDA